METKQAVQAYVLAYMRDHNLTESELARRAGLPQATLNRMLADNPSYRGKVEAWRQLAAYRPLGLDETEVLAAVGLGPRPNHTDDMDPWQLFEAAMRSFRLKAPWRRHLREQIATLLEQGQVEPQNGN